MSGGHAAACRAGARVWMLCVLLLLPLLPAPARAAEPALRLDADTPRLSLEGLLEHFADPGDTLSFQAVSQADPAHDRFVRLPDFRSLGYDTGAHWFRFALDRAGDAPSRWVLAIGTPELEEVDVWVEQPGGGFRQYAMGYHRPYGSRPVRTRLFALPIEVFDGMQVYFRVRTHNAISVHAGLWQVDAFTAQETRSNFYRGLYFGILLIALAFYLILGARLRDGVMAAYAGYITAQLLFHLGTNGYLPVLLGDGSYYLTDALPRLGWLGGAVCITLMWDRLLELKRNHPRIHRLFLAAIAYHLCFVPAILFPGLVGAWVLHAVKLANVLNNLNFLIAMVLLLAAWRRSRRVELMVYFVAFVIPAIGTAVNSGVNWGLLSLTPLTLAFYQAATLVHVLVMSYGLALRLRQLQDDKAAAEQEAALASQRSEEQRRFVAMLSHEFGNPLAAIDRSAQMLQLKLPDLPPAEVQRLAQIRGNATTLAGFVDHFLMTEALDHGALALQRERSDIRALLEAAMRQQGDAAARLRLLRCPGGSFDLDPTLVGVAVGNLLANALRYSPPQGTVELDAALDERGLHVRVADRGPGMSEEDLDKLGTPYWRGAASLGKKGSGLGYHFTRRIVLAHGGTLLAHAREGGGLEVGMFLPA